MKSKEVGKFLRIGGIGVAILGGIGFLAGIAGAQEVVFEGFESGGPAYGFVMQDRGGSYGTTSDIDVSDATSVGGNYAAYLSESWDRVSRPVEFTEGIVSIWFYDGGYEGPNANGIRFRTSADNGAGADWPLDFLTVDMKGRKTGHGAGVIDYYYACKPCVGCGGMNTTFGEPVGSATDFFREYDRWHLVSFVKENTGTTVSIDNRIADVTSASDLAELELLCRSGWYETRPGDPAIMLWDNLCISPKLEGAVFDSTPGFLNYSAGSYLVFSASPAPEYEPLPGAARVARFPGADMQAQAYWGVDAGEIQIWLWDNIADEGGNPDNGSIDILLTDVLDSSKYFRLRTYETVMGAVADQWYVVTPQSPTGMGNSLNVPRLKGWNLVVFHKDPDGLRVSINGQLVRDASYRWDDPPLQLEFSIVSRSGSYGDGNPLWLGKVLMSGGDLATSAVIDWERYR